MRRRQILTAGAVATTLAAATAAAAHAERKPTPPGLAKKDTLAFAAGDVLEIGCAVAGGGHHLSQPYPDPFTHDEPYRKVLAAEFTSLSAENQMKWDHLRPAEGVYDFTDADAIADFAAQNGQVMRGHTLLWHNQNPAWLEEGDHTPAQLREILRDHIQTVVGRYAGRMQQWDVANEIFDDSAALRTEANIWIRELGPGIIADAFRWAHEADPEAQLFLNDYNVEGINPKSDAYHALVQELLADGVPVHGFSTQGHLSTRYGFPDDLAANLRRFADLGLRTAITELDVRIDLPEGGEPTAEQLATQAEYYRRTTEAVLAVEGCGSLTLWGVVDRYSWVPVTFPGQGAATVLRDDLTRKPAYDAVQHALAAASGRAGHPALRD
ncbi:1,4-beta-xylanase [Brachybacterium sp. SGAir0954]|uniref:endo-1,4-beta-xylanase n=1 Tax=Brachybacterium sp. SGAir0954 TaxID=2571029 RepID=UPI0010CCD57B|nr:endo-1,4-beta-xylanase [Brachybacterium sp. SGAir0954]QCR52522.1 1,4-beta-xylanase [Brachybacterium sp. SGAir0954]